MPNTSIVNIIKTQQHPFHVLTSSKLPILMSLCAGCTALTFVMKLHAAPEINVFKSVVIFYIMDPFLYTIHLAYTPINILVMFGIVGALLTIFS